MDENNETFVLPEEYKDVQSVQGCKSVEDLCKKVVDDESFIGKLKSERAMPTENDGDDVWGAFFEKTKAVADKQDWTDVDENIASVLKGAGLVKQQAKPIIDFIQAQNDKLYDESEFNQMKADAFKGSEDKLKKVDVLLSKLPKESIERLNATKNSQLVDLYKVLADVADTFAVSGMTTPPSNLSTGSDRLTKTDGSMDMDVLNRMQNEILSIGNVPNKQELKEAIFKKYGWK